MIYEIHDPLVKLLNWQWLEDLSVGSILIRLTLCIICGGLIGVERSKKHMAAGLRTYILVCLGSAVAMMTNEFLAYLMPKADAGRIAAQVISGIGFLGAGTIIVTSRNQIRGLTTAAGLWAVACLGLAIGTGYYTLSILATTFLVLVLSILPIVEKSLQKRSSYFPIHIEFPSRTNMKDFLVAVREKGIKVSQVEHNPAYSASGLSVYTVVLYLPDKNKRDHKILLEEISALPYVNYVEEMK